MRTHRCGEVRASDAGTTVELCGWVHTRRDHGGVIFIDLRDVSGLVQIVFNPDSSGDLFSTAEQLRSEYCIKVTGPVRERPEGTVNPKLDTGEVEVVAESIEIFSRAETPPFQVDSQVEVDEQLRLKHRYIDLRRPEMQANLKLRHA
ncbi:MAG TPA: OB-fold nucleic acid binding domain-containing protein, partial [Actinomycetota bacterium]|nr:OB-fold nucleic acid binding domain-containing protein [Actinomycetota bacterium]